MLKTATKIKLILERLDEVIIAEMIAKRFHGPFLNSKDVYKRLDTFGKMRKKYVPSGISSARC